MFGIFGIIPENIANNKSGTLMLAGVCVWCLMRRDSTMTYRSAAADHRIIIPDLLLLIFSKILPKMPNS